MFTVTLSGKKYRVARRYKHPKPADLKGVPLMSTMDVKDYVDIFGKMPDKRLIASKYSKQHETWCVIFEQMELTMDTPEWFERSKACSKCFKGGIAYDEGGEKLYYIPADPFDKNKGRKHSLGLALKFMANEGQIDRQGIAAFWEAYNEMGKKPTQPQQPKSTAEECSF
jgi:hypothetical protein